MLLHILKEPLKSFSGSLVFKALHDSYSYIRAKSVVKHQGPQLCKAPTPFSSSTEKLQEKFHRQECWEQRSLFGAPALGQVQSWSRDVSLCEGTAHGHSSSGHLLDLPGTVTRGKHRLHHSLQNAAIWKCAIKSIILWMPSILLELAGLGRLQMCCHGGKHPSESAQLRLCQPPHHSMLTYSLLLWCR